MILIVALILAGRIGIRAIKSRTSTRSDLQIPSYTIICATRGGKDSQPTHERAIKIAKEQGAEIIFLYVFDQGKLHGVATPIVINVEAQMKHMLGFLQQTAQAQARQAGVSARIIVRPGSLREQIKDVTINEQVNLIIMGNPAERSSLFKREALQAIADKIEESTGVEVLVLGSQDG